MTMILILACSLVLSTIGLSHCEVHHHNSTKTLVFLTPVTFVVRLKVKADPERVEKATALTKKICENPKALTEKQVQGLQDCPLTPQQRNNTNLVECRRKVFGNMSLDERQTRTCKTDTPERLKEIQGQINTCYDEKMKTDPVMQKRLEELKEKLKTMTKEEQVEYLRSQKILAQKKLEYEIAILRAMTPQEQRKHLNKKIDDKIVCWEKAMKA